MNAGNARDADAPVDPAPGRSGLVDPAPGRSGLAEPAPGRSGLVEPAPGRSGLVEPAPGRSGLVEPAPGRSGLAGSPAAWRALESSAQPPPVPDMGLRWGIWHYVLINSAFGAFFITFIRALTDEKEAESTSVPFLLALGIFTGNCVGFSCLAIGKWLRRRWAPLQAAQRTLLYFLSFGGAGIVGAVLPLFLAGLLQKRGASILVLCIGFVAGAASLIVMVIEEMTEKLSTYYRQEQQRDRLERDLRVARLVQTAMFPRSIPSIPGVALAARSVPAKEVGGDYYDFIPLPDGRLLIAVADVAGKGLSAALLMSALRAGLRTLAQDGIDLAVICDRLNRLILEASDKFNYITFFICIYDPVSRRADYVNAGHNPPVHISAAGQVREEAPGDLVLGVMPGIDYQVRNLTLDHGELFAIYTDGMIEQHGLGDADFGLDRLTAVLAAHRQDGVHQALQLAYEAVADFSANEEQYDDQTMVLIMPA